MSAPADIAAPEAPDRDEQMLARLAELDLAAAERAHERFMAAEDGPQAAEAGRTYQRMARSLRQTLAIKARLKRERETAARDEAKAVAQRQARKAMLRADIGRGVRLMAEPAEREQLFEALERELEAETRFADFEDAELEDLIARVCARLPLDPERIASVTRVGVMRAAGLWPDDRDPAPPSWPPQTPGSPRRESG